MARKGAVEHLRNSTGDRYAGSRKLGDDQAVAAGRAATLEDGPVDGQACGECGTMTKRTSGLCRDCDPASKKNTGRARATGPAPGKPAQPARPAGLQVDRTQPAIAPAEIRQCGFGHVPEYRNGALVDGSYRQCKNAVVAPAEHCHEHGGSITTSLGRTVAKANAEAERGDCYPVAAAHWEQADARLEAAYGQLAELMSNNTAEFASMVASFRAQQSKDGVGRFSASNQMLVMAQYLTEPGALDGDLEDAWARVEQLMAEPHMTARQWAEVGREPEGRGVAVVYYRPGSSRQDRPEQQPGETDAAFQDRLDAWSKSQRRIATSHIQYPLSRTSGTDYAPAVSPLDKVHVRGNGDVAATRAAGLAVGERLGFKIEFTDHAPANGAKGYWSPTENKIVVVHRPDERDELATYFHELGHAMGGHGMAAGDGGHGRRPDMEAEAEFFSHLAMAHAGFDTSAKSAGYVKSWQHMAPEEIDMRAGGVKAARAAAASFDRYLAELDG